MCKRDNSHLLCYVLISEVYLLSNLFEKPVHNAVRHFLVFNKEIPLQVKPQQLQYPNALSTAVTLTSSTVTTMSTAAVPSPPIILQQGQQHQFQPFQLGSQLITPQEPRVSW